MEKNYGYTDAFDELQRLVQEIESGQINIDELADKIKRAAVLLQICRAKLTSTEEEVSALLQQLDPPHRDSQLETETEKDIEEEG